jgi:hypothetical protein
LALLLIAFPADLAAAGPVAAPARERSSSAGAPPRWRAAPPLLGWSFRKGFSWVRSALNNRTRMVQLATIGMLIGLFIMMRK